MPRPTKRELVLWARLWAKPQAVQWEQLGLDIEVALYVRRLIEAEARSAPLGASTLVRQLGDSLGLTVPGMRANRWRIEAEDAPAPSERRPAAARPAARDRFRVVGG
jgi:hypothetical protein